MALAHRSPTSLRLALLLMAMVGCGGGSGGSDPAPPPPPPTPITISFQPHLDSTDDTYVGLTAVVTGTTDTRVDWSIVEPGGGSLLPTSDPLTRYFQPPSDREGTFHVRAARTAAPSQFVEAAIQVRHPVRMFLEPAGPIALGSTHAFTATVTRTSDTRVTWSVIGEGHGTIDAAGVYTPPSLPGLYQVTATSLADPTVSQSTSALVYDPTATVTLSPASQTVAAGSTVVLTSGIQPEHPATLMASWMEGPAPWTLNRMGNTLYATVNKPGTYTVHIQYFLDPRLEATATIVVP